MRDTARDGSVLPVATMRPCFNLAGAADVRPHLFDSIALLLAATLAAPALGQAPARPAANAAPKPAAKPATPRAAPGLPAASSEQIAAASFAHTGEYLCEFDERVHVAAHPKSEGYLDVRHRKAVHTMRPVVSSTGAIRLEDVRGRMLMLQIANKSMLMDTKLGQRVVDNCVHEKQRGAAPAPAGESLGIDPAKRSASAPS
jgi:hypothetical protein